MNRNWSLKGFKINGVSLRKYLLLDFYYTVLRKDWQASTFLLDIVLKTIAVIVVSIDRFIKDACTISASALTFYSILSLIPIVALAFAIARGFGVAVLLEEQIREQSLTNPEITDFVVQFANQALENTRGGLFTGIGIVILLWAVIRVLGSTELAMNRIWGVRKGRGIVKKFTDYMSIMFIAPILIVLVSSLNVFLSSNLQEIAMTEGLLGYAGSAINSVLNWVPYVLVWVLFIFLYMFMPTTPVKFRYAFWAGIIAGTVYQIVQWFYIKFQIGVTSYNAIYGSLAALPLLLVWLQLSWSIVLWGTELCYIFRNRHFMFRNAMDRENRWVDNIGLAIKILKYIASEYMQGKGGPTLAQISTELKINTSKLRIVLEALADKHILAEVSEDDDVSYFPAIDFHDLSLADVIIRLSYLDNNKDEEWRNRFIEAVNKEFSSEKFV